MQVYTTINDLLAREQIFAVATVVAVRGSASAGLGSKAVFDHSGRNLVGWVGGGCAETYVASQALEAMADGRPRLFEVNLDDEVFGLGLPCGGYMDVFVEPHIPRPALVIGACSGAGVDAADSGVRRLMDRLGYPATLRSAGGTPAALLDRQNEQAVLSVFAALVAQRQSSARPLSEGRAGGDDAWAGEGSVLPPVSMQWPPRGLLLFGASRITEELAHLAVLLDWPVEVYAPKFRPEDYPEAAVLTQVAAGYRNLTVRPGTAVVVASHHRGDPDFIETALRAQALYIGLVASRKRASLVLDEVRGRVCHDDALLAQLIAVRAPAGLDCACTTPAEIALSIVAEVLSLMRGGREGVADDRQISV